MRSDSPFLHAKHALRAFLLLILALVLFVLGRSMFVPASWGAYGPFRGDNVVQQMALPPRHGGNAACTTCHDTQPAALAAGSHATLACEGCHAPLAVHVQEDEKIADMPTHKSADLCLLCHAKLEARPAEHAQILPRAHLEELGVAETSDQVCFDCHDPHSPI